MPNVKISQLPSGSSVSSQDMFPSVKYSTLTTNQVTAAQLAAYITSSIVSVAGSATQVQFNDSGTLGADSGFIYDKTVGRVSVEKLQNLPTEILVTNRNGTAGAFSKVRVENDLMRLTAGVVPTGGGTTLLPANTAHVIADNLIYSSPAQLILAARDLNRRTDLQL